MDWQKSLGRAITGAGLFLGRFLKGLGRLLKAVWYSSGDDKPSIDSFPEVDVEKTAFHLRLRERGKERGEKGEPSTDSSELDEVELQIIEKIESKKKEALAFLTDQLETFNERVGGLGLESKFDIIKTEAIEAVSNFKVQIASGRDALYNKRRTLVELEAYYKKFRERHHLSAPANSPGEGKRFLTFAVLVFALLAETVLNGNFLAEGSIYGQLGGTIEAFTFAAVNIIGCFLLSFLGVRQISRRDSIFYRVAGFAALLLLIALAVGLNLLLAHYREIAGLAFATGQSIEQAGADVISNLIADPLGLKEVKSWMLLGLGLIFSTIAFLDGLFFDDPYPGYGPLWRRVHSAHQDYIETKDSLIVKLQDTRSRAKDNMEDSRRDLSMRRDEYSAILSNRSFMMKRFDEHMGHMERALNALLSCYRNANKDARNSDEPKRFRESRALERPAIPDRPIKEWKDEDLGRSIDEVSVLQEENIRRLHAEFDGAIVKYDQIDDLVPDELSAQGANNE